MLILSRYPSEVICIGDDIWITVLKIRGYQVVLGIDAPQDIAVHRLEVVERIDGELLNK